MIVVMIRDFQIWNTLFPYKSLVNQHFIAYLVVMWLYLNIHLRKLHEKHICICVYIYIYIYMCVCVCVVDDAIELQIMSL